jgi:(p)ppGpp synthase/HD superfamily hydrolase
MEAVSSEQEKIVAVLHDVLEDTSIPESTIESMFGPVILDAVKSVSRIPGEVYIDFILRAKQNRIGRKVKIADIKDNMLPERIITLPIEQQGIVKRYIKALKILEEV